MKMKYKKVHFLLLVQEEKNIKVTEWVTYVKKIQINLN